MTVEELLAEQRKAIKEALLRVQERNKLKFGEQVIYISKPADKLIEECLQEAAL